MICPDCRYDNIAGVDVCEQCGQPLVAFDYSGSELEQSITRHSIDVLLPKKPVSVDASSTVRQAVAEMVDRKIGCLLVEQGGELAGIFTERDLLNRISGNLQTLDLPVSEFMTRAPATITSRDSIAYALQTMGLGGYRHLAVIGDDGRPTGIISIRDILRFLCVRFAETRASAG